MSNVLATVGGMPITEEDVSEFLAGLGQRGQAYNNPEGRKAVVGQLVANKLLLLDARRNLYEAEPAFKAELAKMRGVNVVDDEACDVTGCRLDSLYGDLEILDVGEVASRRDYVARNEGSDNCRIRNGYEGRHINNDIIIGRFPLGDKLLHTVAREELGGVGRYLTREDDRSERYLLQST